MNRAARVLGVVAGVFVIYGVISGRWLEHHDDRFGLLGLWIHDGAQWVWHWRWVEVAREMGESGRRETAWVASGITAFAAGLAFGVLALVTAYPPVARRRLHVAAIVALALAVGAAAAWLILKPELEDPAVTQYLSGRQSMYEPSWSLYAFVAGVLAFVARLRFLAKQPQA